MKGTTVCDGDYMNGVRCKKALFSALNTLLLSLQKKALKGTGLGADVGWWARGPNRGIYGFCTSSSAGVS